MRIGLLGAFGVNNTGDNLVAIATKAAIEERIKDADITVFSPQISAFTDISKKNESDLSWCAVDLKKEEFWREIYDYDALIIGGGGLLVPVAEFEPFIFHGTHIDLTRLPKTAWNALGSQWAPTASPKLAEWYAKLKKATDKVDYISVRSITTCRLLENTGCPKDKINLVSDPVIGLSIENSEQMESEFEKRFHIDRERQVLGVSVGPEIMQASLKLFMTELAKAINALNSKGVQTIIFPFGLMYGDDIACKELAKLCPGSFLVEDVLSPIETWTLVGMFDAYITVRYHGMVSAVSRNTPALALDCYLSNDTAGSKLRDFIWQCGLDNYYMSPMISVCGEPSTRSFCGMIDTRKIWRKIVEKVEELLSPYAKDMYKRVSQKLNMEVKNHFCNMLKSLDLL
ncbi:polysaccharide pyruvyl transferase family protein [Acetivibrio straminisolvens]|jgi:polysaccharide pyruvyl transferase WcaK-like protein|uniref:Polysaccharide pyruvyl transferase n=1 Tax=Acetivibrio straminisolvens JCM 21531 TaxID=1294263 RepID=W4V494_9FIRM|nr:polysaccharide pyruvyl transferase family protein [Acetivibrio straminisolvens]GAE87564.1 polysaccharide pyruvyl transferase [Acetivibrio straminisolvens JCM 21531]